MMFIKNKVLFISLSLLSALFNWGLNTNIYSQEFSDSTYFDTLHIKSGSTLEYKKLLFKFKKDTLILLPKGTSYKLSYGKASEFYKKLEEKTQKSLVGRELNNIILVKPNKSTKRDSFKTQISAEPYYPYENKIIRKIIVKQLPVFGSTITDTSINTNSILEKTANRLHFQTKRFLIHKNLLFKPNDFLNANILADNERLLRDLSYFDDTKIDIINTDAESDSVDVLIIVKDNWSKAFNLETDKFLSGHFDLVDKNILGLGQEMQNSLLWDQNRNPRNGYQGVYFVPNIAGTFFKGTFLFNKSFGSQTVNIDLNRVFFTPNVKYAGGFNFRNVQSDVLYFSNNPPEYKSIEYNHTEAWIGRSFYINRKTDYKYRENLTLSFKTISDHFFERPAITHNSYYFLQNKTLYLANLSFTKQNYFKSNQIYNFGRTEDIPVGSELGITAGYEQNEFKNRYYLSGNLGYGKFFGHFGYIQASLAGAGFNNKTHIEQGIITASASYFSNLFVINKYNVRQFISFSVVKGINRFSREFVTINNKNGILGFINDSVYGTQRVNMKWETDCFTPWNIFDFKCVIFIYADHSWIGNNGENLINALPYTGFGFGVRLRNERLVFNTLQLRFTFFPNIPPATSMRQFRASGEPIYNQPNFSPKPPSLIDFK